MKIIHVYRSGTYFYHVYCRVRKTWVRLPSTQFIGKVTYVSPYTYTQKHPFLFKSRIECLTDYSKCFYYHIDTGVWETVYE